jgi:hypothetical protein
MMRLIFVFFCIFGLLCNAIYTVTSPGKVEDSLPVVPTPHLAQINEGEEPHTLRVINVFQHFPWRMEFFQRFIPAGFNIKLINNIEEQLVQVRGEFRGAHKTITLSYEETERLFTTLLLASVIIMGSTASWIIWRYINH